MIVLTGGAGFIGSVLLKRLNDLGRSDILVVDWLTTDGWKDPQAVQSPSSWHNLDGKKFVEYLDKDAFLDKFDSYSPSDIDAIIHLGAISSTTFDDPEILKHYNLEYSQILAQWCFRNEKQFIYASSAATYGNGSHGFSDDHDKIYELEPLNLYGLSKHVFDLWLLDNGFEDLCTGFKFFNVFGPNEYHKGHMASLVYKAYHQINETGKMRLFKSYDPRYKHGESVRDFIYVKDCVDVLMWSLEHPEATGIFNLGSGKARSWNDLAAALFAAMGKEPNIEYIDMPEEIRGAYQYFTEADMTKLRRAGYTKALTELEPAVKDYVLNSLSTQNKYL